jgi:cytochrome c oxidase subunit I
MAMALYERTPAVVTEGYDSADGRELEELWESKPGLYGWLATVDHKTIGLRYIITAFAFLVLGGVAALIMRLQLARPNEDLLSPDAYNQLFSIHGATMILWYAFPVLTGFSVYLQPLILGSRDMAFPRLNAFTYWVFLFSGIFLWAGLLNGTAPNDGWFNYVPYASRNYNPGPNIDFYALANIFLGISTTLGSINFIVTIMRGRAPGMSINRLPILSWGTLTASAANVLAVPAVSLAFFMLWMDRNVGTHFFTVPSGGQPLLWQHLFWMWGHPWVYAIVLPAISIVSEALPVFCRRPLVGYTAVALATVMTMVLGFGVWMHHMFATGLPSLGLAFFSVVSLLIVIPSAVSFFAWMATIWTGRLVFNTVLHFLFGFIFVFVVGGVSGFMTGSVPVDWQLTDTYFVVGHIHYVLIGWNLFAVMAGIYYWFPKWTGHMMNEALGRLNFWLVFIGFNLGFFPMHIVGLKGMPRRVYTYPDGLGWNTLNLLETIGSFIFALGVIVLLINVLRSRKGGLVAGPNPWDAATLEWTTPSPPPPYNFVVFPRVASRMPLWEDRLQETPLRTTLHEGMVLKEGKEQISTSMLDGQPDLIAKMPEDSILPLLLSLELTAVFIGFILLAWWLIAAGVGLGVLTMIVWLWPRERLAQVARASHV